MADRPGRGPDLTNSKKRYAVDVIRLRAGERHRSTIPAMSKIELRTWARELNPFDVTDIVLMEMGDVLGTWTKAGALVGVEAFVLALIGGGRSGGRYTLAAATKERA